MIGSILREPTATPLTFEIREAIVAATSSFVYWEAFERTAPSRGDPVKQLEAIEKAALDLSNKVSGLKGVTGIFVSNLISRHFQDNPQFAPNTKIQNLVAALALACSSAKSEIALQSGWKTGEEWNRWVRKLTEILDGAGLPTTAGQIGKMISPSAFTQLVAALQRLLPDAPRRHDSEGDGAADESATDYAAADAELTRADRANDALAKAIQRARSSQTRDS